jgi:hypothetical protein
VGSLPLSVGRHVTATCTAASGMPGHEITILFGGTVNEHVELTHELFKVIVH